MKIKLPRSAKSLIRKERDRVAEEMVDACTNKVEWEEFNKKYKAYTEMLKPTWTVTPDTILVVAGNLAGILLILNFEKLDIVRSKAMSLLLKGRV